MTGAGSGIGAAIARLFARSGARRGRARSRRGGSRAIADAIRDAGGGRVGLCVRRRRRIRRSHAVSPIEAGHRRIDILVNNAGIAHVGTIETTTPKTISIGCSASTSRACSSARAPRFRSCSARAAASILNMASIASLVGRPRSLRLLDDQGRRADDDAIDRGRLREAGHPLQLHLPGAHPHAVRRRLPRAATTRPRGGDAAAAVRVPADRPHGHAGGGRAPGAVSLLRRSGVRHRPGLPDRRRSVRVA